MPSRGPPWSGGPGEIAPLNPLIFEKFFCCSSRGCCRLHARWTRFSEQFWDQIRLRNEYNLWLLAEAVWQLFRVLEKKLSKGCVSSPVYIYESGFSTLLHVKTKNRNWLNFTLKDDLRCALSTTQPRIHNLVENVPHQSKNHTENWSLSGSLLCVAVAKIK